MVNIGTLAGGHTGQAPPTPSDWSRVDLAFRVAYAQAAGDPFAYLENVDAPRSFYDLHALYRDVNGHVSEIWTDGSRFKYQDLTALT